MTPHPRASSTPPARRSGFAACSTALPTFTFVSSAHWSTSPLPTPKKTSLKSTPKSSRPRAILYTRVSTDEQADRGYSLRDQEARLREYCKSRGIEVIRHFQDDHSAKTFDRPAWQQLLAFLRANRGAADQVLFVKWDRFSRDATDALGMIKTLDALGVEPQAIDQPIDRSVPEQLMMLAIYVAAPEVENQRRSLNTKAGMRRAMREGRWCNRTPKGYRRGLDERGRATIEPDADADHVRKAFHLAAYTTMTMEDIRRQLRREGFSCSKNQFTLLLRNPIYAGKILLPAWRDEPEELVDGLHTALVEESVYQRVQRDRFGDDGLDRYGRRQRGAIGALKTGKLQSELVLRGHLLCTGCGELLTGSGSKGNGGRYWYYHCHRCGSCRYRAEEAHEALTKYLDEVSIAREIVVAYDFVLQDLTASEEQARVWRRQALRTQITATEERLFLVDEKWAIGDLARDSYQRLKSRYCDELAAAQRDLEELERGGETYFDQLAWCLGLFSNLGKTWKLGRYARKT